MRRSHHGDLRGDKGRDHAEGDPDRNGVLSRLPHGVSVNLDRLGTSLLMMSLQRSAIPLHQTAAGPSTGLNSEVDLSYIGENSRTARLAMTE
ncbi:MAG TPA: hypothetical protein VFG35_03755 [Actinoplanes sp.]|nr:hypothetical protein [Actinoplanes sp.]